MRWVRLTDHGRVRHPVESEAISHRGDHLEGAERSPVQQLLLDHVQRQKSGGGGDDGGHGGRPGGLVWWVGGGPVVGGGWWARISPSFKRLWEEAVEGKKERGGAGFCGSSCARASEHVGCQQVRDLKWRRSADSSC